jgi:thiol:disulfide interchange protein DsbG
LFYITPDGQSLIVGLVFDQEGNNVTSADMKKAGVVSTLSSVGGAKMLSDAQLQSLWDRAEKRRWVQEGKSGKVIYAIFDPNCPYCHRLWRTLEKSVKAGKIRVRWLPVALLKDTSKGMGAAIYTSAKPSEALAMMANQQLPPLAVVNDQENQDMAHNLLLLRDTGYTGVPVLMFKRGSKVVTMMGAPDDRELAVLLQQFN